MEMTKKTHHPQEKYIERGNWNKISSKGVMGLEVMVIVVVLLAAVSIAIPLFLNVSNVNRENVTLQKILDIKKAIIGDPSIRQKGYRSHFGFVGDLGVLPNTLTELIVQGGLPAYGFANNVWFGWRGPYLPDTQDGSGNYPAFYDAWGQPFSYTFTGGISPTWSAEIRSAGPDGALSTGDDIFINISDEEIRTYVTGTFKDRAGDPIEEDQVTIYFPNGTGLLDSVQITTNPADKTQYDSQTDTISDTTKRKIPIGIRYLETLRHTLRKLGDLNGGGMSVVNFVAYQVMAATGPFFERTFYGTDDTDPSTGSPITQLMGTWQTDGSGNYYASGGVGEYRAAFGDPTWEDYRIEVDATLYQGQGYGIYYRSDGLANITGYVFQFEPGLYTPLGSGIELVIRKVYMGDENYFPPADRFLASVRLNSADFSTQFGSNIYNDQHHISITVIGDRHIIKLDGQTIIDITDTEPLFPCGGLCGSAGLRSWDGQRYTDFHHLLVYDIPPLPTAEVVWWSFEEGSGPTVYGSGFLVGAPEINGTINNPPGCTRRWNGFNIHGQAIYLDGTDSGYINFGDVFNFSPTSTFSISLWARIDSGFNPANQYVVLSKRRLPGNGRGWEINLTRESGHGFGAEFFLRGVGGGRPGQLVVLNDMNGSGINGGEWYHIVVVYDGSGYSGSTVIDASALRIYVTSQSSNFVETNPTLAVIEESLLASNDTTHTTEMRLGLDNGGNNGFYGDIDEVKMYSHALSDEEIEALFQLDK